MEFEKLVRIQSISGCDVEYLDKIMNLIKEISKQSPNSFENVRNNLLDFIIRNLMYGIDLDDLYNELVSTYIKEEENSKMRLEELELKYKELGKEIEKLKNEKEGLNWNPDIGESFYYIFEFGNIVKLSRTTSTEYILQHKKIFQTEDEAKDYKNYINARDEYVYKFSKEEWNNRDINKYTIYYNYKELKLSISFWNSINYDSTLYFKTSEKAYEFINKYKEQILKYEFDIVEE